MTLSSIDRVFRDIGVVALMAVLVLVLGSAVLDTSSLHLNGLDYALNDQIGYISTARNLARTGSLESSLVYPAVLSQENPKEYLYFPGYYVALALSYFLFGDGVLQAQLPSLGSFVIAAVCTFLIGKRLYDRRCGFLAAFLGCFFPFNIVLSFTAMSEPCVTMAAAMAFCVFLYLPGRFQAALGPLLLVFPFLFRESTAFLVIPMMAIAWREPSPPDIRRAVMVLLIAVPVLLLICASSLAGSRQSLTLMVLFVPQSNWYVDAVATRGLTPGWQDLVLAVWGTVQGNARIFYRECLAEPFQTGSLGLIVLAGVGACLVGARRWRTEPFLIGAGLYSLVTWVFVMAFHLILNWGGLRVLSSTWPLVAVCLARLLLLGAGRRRAAVLAGLMAAIGMLGIVSLKPRIGSKDQRTEADTRLIERIGHDNQRMLVTPFWLMPGYVYRYHPVKWAFLPRNRETLDLLAKKYVIGTVLLPIPPVSDVTPEDLVAIGLSPVGIVRVEGEAYLVYRRL